MNPHQRLANKLMTKFGLPPGRPNSTELSLILSDVISASDALKRNLTDDEWRVIVQRHVGVTGHWKYEGLDFQDLNFLLAQIRAQANSRRG
jgi:hypothetical protein